MPPESSCETCADDAESVSSDFQQLFVFSALFGYTVLYFVEFRQDCAEPRFYRAFKFLVPTVRFFDVTIDDSANLIGELFEVIQSLDDLTQLPGNPPKFFPNYARFFIR